MVEREKKPMKYKMICCDLDGTLLNNQSQVDVENLQAIEELVKKGVHFVPSTGRAFMELPEALRNCESIRYIISSNGAIIYDKLTGESYKTVIEGTKAREVLDVLKSYDAHITLRKDGQSIIDADAASDEVFAYYRMFQAHRFVLAHFGQTSTNFDALCQTVDLVDFFTVVFHKDEDAVECMERLEALGGLRIARIDVNALEIMHIDAGKGNALRTLANMLGIGLEETISIGDSDNDSSITQTAGLGLAVSNASPALKELADEVICSNEEHAVVYVLNHYF